MNIRTETILRAIVEEYTKTAIPVSSLNLVEKYNLKCSPATVRLEMAKLEKEGYIYQPHTSAGRVPTDKGYRYYINNFNKKVLLQKEERIIEKRLSGFGDNFDRALKEATKILAEVTKEAALSGTENEFFYCGFSNLIRQPEFFDLERSLALADFFERLYEISDFLSPQEEVKVLVGEENPFGKKAGCSLVLGWFETPYQTSGYVGILGPTRMDYEKNISRIKKTTSVLEEL